MANNVKPVLNPTTDDQLPPSRGNPTAYEDAVDEQRLAFLLSLFTRDFTFFHVLRAQDRYSGANAGADLRALCPERSQAIIHELLSYSKTTIQAIQDSYKVYCNGLGFHSPTIGHGEDPPPPGRPPLTVPRVVELIQQHNKEIASAIDKNASYAKALIKDLANNPTQHAAIELWAQGLQAVAPVALACLQQAYAIFDPVPGLSLPIIGQSDMASSVAARTAPEAIGIGALQAYGFINLLGKKIPWVHLKE